MTEDTNPAEVAEQAYVSVSADVEPIRDVVVQAPTEGDLAPEPRATEDADLVDAMNDDELRAFITKRDGKAPHHRLGHENLLALAKNGNAAKEEAKDITPSLANPELLGVAKIKHPEGATSCSFNGETFDADADGVITVPNDAVADLAAHGFVLV